MRALFALVFLAAAGWAGYWFVGSNAQENAMRNWLDDRTRAGWVADRSDVAVRGFPNRFDTTVTDLKLADPSSGWAWDAPEFQIKALSYQPNHVVALWPQTQTISTPLQKIKIDSTDIRSSLKFLPNTELAFDAFTTELDQVTLTSSAGWQSKIDSAILAARRAEAANTYDIALDASGFAPAEQFREKIDKAGVLPAEFETLNAKATAKFDGQWDRLAIEGRKPLLQKIDLTDAVAVWGGLELAAKGAVDVDAAGYPTGKVTVRAKNWKEMIAIAQQSGAIRPEMASTLESGLGLIAMLSGNKDRLDVPLTFKNRVVSLGPIPIGPAPRIVLPKN